MTPLVPRLFLLAALATAACRSEGEYELSWRFADVTGLPVKFSAAECGAHGVEAFDVIEQPEGGSLTKFAAPCGRGGVTRSVSAGRFRLFLNALNLDGHVQQRPDSKKAVTAESAPFEVDGNGPPVTVMITIAPLPACGDGVDNDRDGRVDLDDPDCAGLLAGASEAPAMP
jgi:hypothetical protein